MIHAACIILYTCKSLKISFFSLIVLPSENKDLLLLLLLFLLLLLLATNQRVVAAQRQQQGLVALTIRGSVLFYSSAIRRPDFHSVNREFLYLYGVDSIELKTLFYR